MKRALVSGPGGFIASHLVKRLKADHRRAVYTPLVRRHRRREAASVTK